MARSGKMAEEEKMVWQGPFLLGSFSKNLLSFAQCSMPQLVPETARERRAVARSNPVENSFLAQSRAPILS